MWRALCEHAIGAVVAAATLSLGWAAPTPPPSPTPELYSPQTVSELKKLEHAALTSDYGWRQVAHLANNIGPRLSGSAQAQKAVEYVAVELKALGLEVQLEKVMVPHWVRGDETASLVQFPGQAPGTTQKVVLTALGGSVATPPDGLTAEVAVVRDFDELKSLGKEKIGGRIVVFNYAFDRRMAEQGWGGEAYGEAVVYRSDAPSAAARLGAVAVLIRSVGNAAYRLPHTGLTTYATDAPKIPAAALAEEDADLIAALVPQGAVRLHLVLTPKELPDAVSYNVIADLKGSEHPEQVVIVSGHLDSWDLGTGAIDDGAGVAVAMEAAHLVRQLGLRPRRTIRVIAWMNEENGLRGGETYAAEHANDIGNQFAAIETDGGAGHPLGIYIAGQPGLRTILQPIANVLRDSGAGLLDFRDEVGADIDPLAKLGVPNFSPIQDSRFYFNYHHTAADTLDKIDRHELAENAAINAVLSYGLANLEQPLPQ
ncbi:MAG TPA: M20/M25/M40 family metallo-hydrolase [Chthoniobacterales bacterium]|nr:M20/M25/M40 family metallo-hydrolase [Chthoniobacterales bacterium]